MGSSGGSPGITLTMDVAQFEEALNKVLKGFGGMEKGMGKMSSGMVAKGMIIANVITGLAVKAGNFIKSGISSGIPEIAKTFGIAGDIIQRNLLYPLRKELIPLLQKLLNWVRDHRVMFVMMGNVIANVFRTIKQIIISFVTMFSKIWDQLAGKIEQIFGKSTQSIMDIINLVLFKIAAVVIFMQVLLEPVFSFIGEMIGHILFLFNEMVKGIAEGAGDLSTNFTDILDAFSDIGRMVKDVLGDTEMLGKAFKVLGIILGTTLKPILFMISTALSLIAEQIDATVFAIKWAKAKLTGTKEEVRELEQDFKQRTTERANKIKAGFMDAAQNTVRAIGKAKSVIQGDTVNDNSQQNVYIQVDGSKNPDETAKAVHKSIQKTTEKQGSASGRW